ncbi:helix-turn-helix domain-containing protein, partial [Pyramidobacter sp.]
MKELSYETTDLGKEFIIMNKHLTLAERKAIESALNRRESLRSIASTVLKS